MAMYNNLIYTNGCSFTEGDYYQNRTDCWPWRLNINGFDVLNDALGGGSNHRIMRTTLDTVTRMHGRIKVAVIQWTDPARSETPGGDSYTRVFRNETINDTISFQNWIDQINTLDRFFTCMNIPVFFFNAFTSITQYSISDDIDRTRIENAIDTIDKSKWILPPTTTLCEWINDGTRNVFRDDGHLLAPENFTVATKFREYILERI